MNEMSKKMGNINNDLKEKISEAKELKIFEKNENEITNKEKLKSLKKQIETLQKMKKAKESLL
jgi:hypothetical protein